MPDKRKALPKHLTKIEKLAFLIWITGIITLVLAMLGPSISQECQSLPEECGDVMYCTQIPAECITMSPTYVP